MTILRQYKMYIFFSSDNFCNSMHVFLFRDHFAISVIRGVFLSELFWDSMCSFVSDHLCDRMCVCVFWIFFFGGEGFVPHFFDRIFLMSHHFCDMMFSFSTVIVCDPSSVTISVMCSYLIDFFSNIIFCVLVTSSVIGCVLFFKRSFLWLDVFFWG